MSTQPKVGVVLSGCGFLDGTEIHESVLTLLHLDRAGATAICMAPRKAQAQVVDHATLEPAAGERRDVLAESARIARGKIRDLADVEPSELDALIMPGGYGAAKNLSTFATAGSKAEVDPDLQALLRAMHEAKKPIGAICIAPATLAAALRGTGVAAKLTIGDDKDTAAALETMGAKHQRCAVTEFAVDEANKIASCPAYMFDARIGDVSAGIEKVVNQVVAWARGKR